VTPRRTRHFRRRRSLALCWLPSPPCLPNQALSIPAAKQAGHKPVPSSSRLTGIKRAGLARSVSYLEKGEVARGAAARATRKDKSPLASWGKGARGRRRAEEEADRLV
jgi:hypothetical protein